MITTVSLNPCIDRLPEEEQIINIFMELSALGIAQPLSSNILDFIHALPACAKAKGINFMTPTEICKACKSVSQPSAWRATERASRRDPEASRTGRASGT